jgi:hypothetical protein
LGAVVVTIIGSSVIVRLGGRPHEVLAP